jgi:hypothetical protein
MRTITEIRKEIDKNFDLNVRECLQDIESEIMSKDMEGKTTLILQMEHEFFRIHNERYVSLISMEEQIIQGLFDAGFSTSCTVDHTKYKLNITWE